MTTKSNIQLSAVSLKPHKAISIVTGQLTTTSREDSSWLHLAVVDFWHGSIRTVFKMGVLGPEMKHCFPSLFMKHQYCHCFLDNSFFAESVLTSYNFLASL